VFESGTEDRALYFLLEGSIEIQLDVPFAPQQVLAELQPVSVFGESSFFHPDVHSATACATSESTVIKLGRIAYQGLLDTHNISALRLAANAAEILAAKLQHTDAWIAQLVTNEQMHRIQQKWWDFRQSLGHSFSRPAGGGFSVGAGLRDD
jgi:CRP-like cAMP-binding protein